MSVGCCAAYVLLKTRVVKRVINGRKRITKQRREITLPGMNMR
jgi:hypothetical protein